MEKKITIEIQIETDSDDKTIIAHLQKDIKNWLSENFKSLGTAEIKVEDKNA